MHCFAHKLNLCLQDVGKQLVFLQDALEVVREIAKLIKFLPKRASLFSQVLAQPVTQELLSLLFVRLVGLPDM